MVKLTIPAVLAALLAISPARAGTVGATLSLEQLQIQTSGNVAFQPSSWEMASRIINVSNDHDVSQYDSHRDSWAPLATSAAHGGSLTHGSWNALGGGGELAVSMVDSDAPWRWGNTDLWTNTFVYLAPGASITVSGQVALEFDNSTSGQAFGTGIVGVCLDLAPGECGNDYGRTTRLADAPDGYTDNFSLSWTNTTGTNQQLLWSTNLSVSAIPPSPVPEPAGWGMLVGGLGLLGACRKRYRSA
ncbi:PEP-CTERM sorting domain-containing protein [Massilia eburnea]|uniref:PEP-CTERM sorting domain-containing protein n=1 Tax=Massilia eburnea TaxID=1776165 RepID=UPI003D6A6210